LGWEGPGVLDRLLGKAGACVGDRYYNVQSLYRRGRPCGAFEVLLVNS